MAIQRAPFRPVASPVKTVAQPRAPIPMPQPVQPARPEAPRMPDLPAPPSPLESRKLYQFGQALAQINPKVQQFVNSYYQNQQKAKAQEFAQNFATMDAEQAEAYYREQRETISDRYVAALDRQYGLRQAYREFNQIKADLKAGNIDLATANLEDVLSQRMQASLGSVDSPFFQEGYRAVMAEVVPQLRQVETEFRAQQLRSEADNNFFQLTTDVIAQGVDTNAPPEDVVASIRELYSAYGPGTDLNMSRARMDEIVLDAAAWAADQGHEDVVKAILNTPRQGEDGKTIPALARAKRHRETVDTILKTAERRRNEQLAEQNFGFVVDLYRRAANGEGVEGILQGNQELVERLLSPQQVASLMGTAQAAREKRVKEAMAAAAEQEGRNLTALKVAEMASQVLNDPMMIHRVEGFSQQLTSDPSKTVDVSKDETEQMVVNTVLRSLGVSEGFSPLEQPDVAANVVSFLGQSGYEWKPLRTLLRTAWHTIGADSFADGNIPRHAAEALAWVEAMEAQGHKSIAKQYLSQDGFAFYDTALFLERNVYNGERTLALQEAARRFQQSEDLSEEKLAYPTRDELDRYRRMTMDKMNGWFDGEGDPVNTGRIDQDIRRAAESFIRLGWDREDAYERAAEVVSENYTVVNGYAIPTSNVRVPETIREITRFVAEEFVANGYGEAYGIDDPNDLVLVPVDNGAQTVWQLQSKSIGLLPPAASRHQWALGEGQVAQLGAGVFSTNDLDLIEQARNWRLREEIARMSEQAKAEANMTVLEKVDRALKASGPQGTFGLDKLFGAEDTGKMDEARSRIGTASNGTLTALIGSLPEGNPVRQLVKEEMARRGLTIPEE